MTEAEFTEGAIDLLARHGVHVATVPTRPNVRTPDLRGASGPDVYAIELKQRDSDRVLDAIVDADLLGTHALPPFLMARDQAAQSLIRESVYQLRGEPRTTFRLTWVVRAD